MLSEDPELRFLRIAWSGGTLREYVNRTVLPALLPGAQATRVKRRHTRYSPGKRCDVLCALELAGEEAPRLATLTFATREWLARAGPSAEAFLDEERACLAELFPSDCGMPGLAPATDAAQVVPFLQAAGAPWSGVDARSLRIDVRRYVPHRRCLIQYELATPDGPRRLIGKVYAEAGKATEVEGKLAALRDGLGGIAPAPAGVREAWNLGLMEWLPGESMKGVLRSGVTLDGARDLVRRVAPALAALHSLRYEGGPVHSVRDEVRHVAKRGERIGLVAPALGEQLGSLLERLDAAASSLAPVAPAFIHDGFKPAQVLLDGDRVRIVDYDGSARGDPAIDVGKFMAQLRKEAALAGREDFRALPQYFFEQYVACAGTADVAERTGLAECVALAQIAVQRFRSKPLSYVREGEASLPAALLREADACLARR